MQENQEKSSSPLSENSWFSVEGRDSDVVLSTRVRLARNLANFPFPNHFNSDDGVRVQSLVFDAFSKFIDAQKYQAVTVQNIHSDGIKVFAERGILDNPVSSGFVMGPTENVTTMVNSQDHLRIVTFLPGLDCHGAFKQCAEIDSKLQENLQFAASFEFGYLTAGVKDSGSGMKISVRMHLPSIVYSKKVDEITQFFKKNQLNFFPYYVRFSKSEIEPTFFQVNTISAGNGNEFDQLAGIASAVMQVIEMERSLNSEISYDMPTFVRDKITRSFAGIKFSYLVGISEALEIISNLKWGLNLGLFEGIKHSELCTLLTRVMEGHLEFIMKNENFHFEKDLESDKNLKIQRLRALILQEAFQKIRFIEK